MSKIKNLFSYILIPIAISFLTVIGWNLDNAMLTYLGCAIIGCIVLLFKLNPLNLIFLGFAGFAGNRRGDVNYFSNMAITAYAFGVVFFTLLIRYLIKNKINVKNKVILFLFLIIVSMLLSLINTPDLKTSLFVIAKNTGILLTFVYVYSTCQFNNTFKNFICFIMILVAFVIMAQMGILYLEIYDPENPFKVLLNKRLDLGWDLSNHYVMILSLSLITTFYLYINSFKTKIIYLFILLLLFAVIIATLCRGAILGLGVAFIPMSLCLIFYKKHRSYNILLLLYGAFAFLLFSFIVYDIPSIAEFIDQIIKNDYLDLNGRELLTPIAIEVFNNNYFFGGGAGSSSYYINLNLGWNINNYHNYIYQSLGDLGIVGLFSFTAMILSVFVTCLKKDLFAIIVLCATFYMLGHGLVDTAFYNATIVYFFFSLVALVACRKEIQAKEDISLI